MRLAGKFSLAALLFLGLTSSAASAEAIKVVTSFTILADMTRQLAGDRAEVVSITKPGSEIHGYQPTPHDLVKASDADLVLWNGLGLERWFRQFLAHLDDVPSRVVSIGVTPIPISRGAYDGNPNPHAWMGLADAMIYIDNISTALASIDPEGTVTYEANAKAYKAELAARVAPLREIVAKVPESQRILLTCEGAFSYLARDLGLKEIYIWPVNADQIGTPQQVRRVIDAVRENDIKVVFCESTVSSAPAEQIARETGARFGGVLYVDSLSRADGPVPSYLDLIDVTVSTIARGLMEGGTL
ncbi:MAG: metal ABC transporter substrate-binding protein [Parvularculales bacterium]